MTYVLVIFSSQNVDSELTNPLKTTIPTMVAPV